MDNMVKIKTRLQHEFGGARITPFGNIKFDKDGLSEEVKPEVADQLLSLDPSLSLEDGTNPNIKETEQEQGLVNFGLMKMQTLQINEAQNVLLLAKIPIQEWSHLDTTAKLVEFAQAKLGSKVDFWEMFLQKSGDELKEWLDSAYQVEA